MASIEFIQKRIESKEKEVEKLEKKLERIQKAQATNWEVNPYYYHEDDLKWTLKNLEAAKKSLEGYQEDLKVANEKAGSRNIKVIIDFLQNWKERNMKFYQDTFPKYIEALQEYYQKNSEYCDWSNHSRWQMKKEGRLEEIKEIEKTYKQYERNFRSTWNWFTPYVDRRNCEYILDEAKLQKELDQEADRKYDFIIERTNEIVGQITDASNLTIGNKGDLNGFILGTKGTAKVQTIGAGGYNIQCFHFRTLINKVGK